jgi:hypothetical protein
MARGGNERYQSRLIRVLTGATKNNIMHLSMDYEYYLKELKELLSFLGSIQIPIKKVASFETA